MGNYGFNAQGYRGNNYTPNQSTYAPTPYERMYQQMANSQQPQSYASNQYSAQSNQAAPQAQFNNGIVSGGGNQANNAANQQLQDQAALNQARAAEYVPLSERSPQERSYYLSKQSEGPNLAAEQAAQEDSRPRQMLGNTPNNIDDIRRNVPSAEAIKNMAQSQGGYGGGMYMPQQQYGGMMGATQNAQSPNQNQFNGVMSGGQNAQNSSTFPMINRNQYMAGLLGGR